MANLLDIRRRIKSVKNTQQITKAMKMVSAAKLKRASDRVVNARPFANKMGDVLGELSDQTAEDFHHPLLHTRGIQVIPAARPRRKRKNTFTSRRPRRSSAGCCRVWSKRKSFARCLSRLRPSKARA